MGRSALRLDALQRGAGHAGWKSVAVGTKSELGAETRLCRRHWYRQYPLDIGFSRLIRFAKWRSRGLVFCPALPQHIGDLGREHHKAGGGGQRKLPGGERSSSL